VPGLVYLHPIAMVFVLALGLFVLREGLAVRDGRLTRRPRSSARHRRLGKIVVVLALAGFGAGLASMGLLHAWLGLGAFLGFSIGGAIGLSLERRIRALPRSIHAVTASIGLLLGLAAAVAGLAILP